jgi:uncharacterized protein (UPF0303 family)
MMDIDEGIAIVKKQEEILQFTHFNRQDAWKLGKELAGKILEEELRFSVTIRLRDGFTLFQYAAEGTTVNNESWMTRKFNTVRELEVSSLLTTLNLKKQNRTLEGRGFDPRLYAASGGGFPIRVRGVGLIGVVAGSGLPHLNDHDILVQCIAKTLRIRDLPRIPLDAGF